MSNRQPKTHRPSTPPAPLEPLPGLLTRALALVFALALPVLFLACAPQDEAPAEEATLVVWHAWADEAVPGLEAAVERFEQDAGGTTVELVAFDTTAELRDALVEDGERPDVFLGPHTWAGPLLERGLTAAYCPPGECPECEGANPPRWCRYAKGDFTGYGLIDRFALDTTTTPAATTPTAGEDGAQPADDTVTMEVDLEPGVDAIGDGATRSGAFLCSPDQCPACFGDNPPPWCLAATQVVTVPVDLPRAVFSRFIDGEPFPFGIPVWWEYGVVAADRSWFEERQLELPTTATELRDLDERVEAAVGLGESVRDGIPVPLPFSLDVDEEAADPSPQPSVVGVRLGSSRNLDALTADMADPVVLTLEGYRAPLLFHGAYLREGTEHRDAGLSFMVELVHPEVQRALFENDGYLPITSQPLNQARQGLPEGTLEAGFDGLPVDATPIDLAQEGARPWEGWEAADQTQR